MGEAGIRTTLVGSYPWPGWLHARPGAEALDDATRVFIHLQEAAGIDVVCEGEFARFDPDHPETNGMIEYFVRPMGGVRAELTAAETAAFEAEATMGFRARPAAVAEGPVTGGTLDLAGPCRRARALASRPLKFAMTGPHMLAKTLVDAHYGDRPALAEAVARALAGQAARLDADVVQIDEANLPGAPEEWEWAARAVNVVLDAVPTVAAVHLCFGNYGGQVSQKGARWEPLAAFLDALHADHVVCEAARRPDEELAVLRGLRPEIGIGLGVIDVKATEIESPETVARRIERAAGILGPERIRYVHPDCGFWNLRRNMADGKIAALVAGRDLYEGRPATRAARPAGG